MNWLTARGHTSQKVALTLVLVAVLTLTKPSQCFQDHTTCGQQKVTLTGELAIVGGKPAQVGEWPWQAQMIRDGSQVCGASLVDPHWILTAAHCLDTILNQPGLFQFKMGSNKFSLDSVPNQQIKTAEKIFMHPNYIIFGPGSDYDVALFKLTEPFVLTDYVQTVCVPSADMAVDFPVNTQITVTGWGSTGDEDYYSEDLLEVDFPIVSQSYCQFQYGQQGIDITDNMVCAGESGGGKDSCQGDSGGPMVTKKDDKWFQVGVVSFGIGCGLAAYPGVYARMTAFEDWIAPIFDGNEPIGQGSNCSSRGKYICQYGGCVSYDVKCNGAEECSSGSDEKYCGFPLTFFDKYQDQKLTEASISRREFVTESKDCAAFCLGSDTCVAFDVSMRPKNDGYMCLMADAGYDAEESLDLSITHFKLGGLKAPTTGTDIKARHGYIGSDPSGMGTVFSWDITPDGQINSINFRFTGIHTDEVVSDSTCNNYLTVTHNDETFCLYKNTPKDSFKVNVADSQATVTFNTDNITANGFVAEYNAEWNCDQTIDVLEGLRGQILSPNYPSTYPRFLNCQILLRAPYGLQVKLAPEDFDTNICVAGHGFTVYDQYKGTVLSVLGGCNSSVVPDSVVTTKGEMKIVFTSDKNSHDVIRGYKLTYAVADGDMPTVPVPTQDSFESVKQERDTMQTALIGVSVGAGLVIICLFVWAMKQFSKVGQMKKHTTRNTSAVFVTNQDQPAAGQNGADNRTFNM